MHSNNFEANKEYWRNNFAKKGIVFTFLDTSAEMEYYFKLNLWQVREGVQNTCVGVLKLIVKGQPGSPQISEQDIFPAMFQ